MSPIQFKRCLNQTLHAEPKQEPGSPTNVKHEPAPGAPPPFKKLASGIGISRLALELSSPLSGTRGGKKRPEPLGNAKKNAFDTNVLEKPDVHMGGPGPAATAPDAASLGAGGSADTAPAAVPPAVTPRPTRARPSQKPVSESKAKFNAFNAQMRYLKRTHSCTRTTKT